MSMLNSITKRARNRPAQTAVLTIATVIAIAAAAFVATLLVRDDSQASAQTGEQLEFQVQRGTITTSISTGGTSAFLDRAELSFESAGTVADVMVVAGQTVIAGDVVATLDASAMAQLQVDLASTESAMNAAQAIYENAASGATSRGEIAKAEEALALAELSVTDARNALEQVTAAAGVDGAEVDAAREAVDFAERDLIAALANLDDIQNPTSLSNAEQAADEAISDYREVLMRWLGAVPDDFDSVSLDEILSLWNVSLEAIYTVHAAEQTQSETPWQDNVETPWNDAVVWLWTNMSAAAIDPVATESSKSSVLTPRVEVEAAWTVLDEAQSAFEAEIDMSQSLLLTAEKSVQKAGTDLATAQDELASLLDPAMLTARQAAVDAAVATEDEAAIALDQANANAEAIMNDATSKLALAQQNLVDAKAALESATLTTPISGTVLAVNVDPGDDVTRTMIIAEIADTSVIVVEAEVDEEDILSIEVGLPVSVSLDAVAGRSFTGTVSSIGQADQSQQGAVSFSVTIALDGTDGLNLVEGLTASAQIISSQVSDVVMVPVAAVGGSIFEPTVEVVSSQGAQAVAVQLGASNGSFVEVISGVSEGDTVTALIAGQIGLPDANAQPFIPGGALGGGFRIPGQGGGGFGGGAGGGRGGN